MDFIDPHLHMVSRTTDDYENLSRMGCRAISEPAFWAGFDRGSVDGFRDYFRQLTEVEPRRAALFGIQHFCWLCINAKEAENVSLSREVLAMIPEFIDRPGVLGIGEIGLNKNTKNEAHFPPQSRRVACFSLTPLPTTSALPPTATIPGRTIGPQTGRKMTEAPVRQRAQSTFREVG